VTGAAPPRILVVGPHPDDQEIGMGGTIARLAELGHEILLLDVTDGSPTPRGDRASRLREAAGALERLQPSASKPRIRRALLDLPNRLVEHTIATRHALAGAIRAWQPGIIFTPHPQDAHPDHRAVTRSVEDARFDAKLTRVSMPIPPGFDAIGGPVYAKWLFHYDVSHLRRVAKPDFLVDISGFELKKQAAVLAYRSQFGPWDDAGPSAGPAPFAKGDPKAGASCGPSGPVDDPGKLVSADFPQRLLAIATYWGGLIGTRAAEPFFTPEPLGLTTLAGLVG
jgi:LmbE family N-acetylglucosaminyl deacetylase